MPLGGAELRPTVFRAVLLFLLALGNYFMMYLASMLLARSLTVHDFDDYNVAVSIVTLLSTVATLGLEKYALRAIALFVIRQDWAKYCGFLLFSQKIIATSSIVLVVVLTIGLELVLTVYGTDYHIAIVIYAAFLPIIAMALFWVEVLAAQSFQVLSTAFYRGLLPLIYLCLIGSFVLLNRGLTATIAVLCSGAAWTITCLVLYGVVKRIQTVKIKKVSPLITPQKWLKRSLPLVFSSLLMTSMTSGGVIILELLFPSGTEVGIYAVAMQTGGFISLIGTSTNRYYLPFIVVQIEHKDKAVIKKLIKQRMLLLGALILSLFGLVTGFGQTLLDLFGESYNNDYLTLIVIATGATFSGLFADMPYTLQYMGHNRLVVGLTFTAVIAMITLGFVLGSSYGTLGMAVAYALPVSLLFIGYRLIAGYFLVRL